MPAVSYKTTLQEQTQATTRHRAWWHSVIELLFLLIIAVCILECFLNISGVGLQEFLKPDPILGCKHIPNKTVVWRLEGFSCDRLSSSGLRDIEHSIQKPPGITRIALLGDSATEGVQVPLHYTFARLLEQMLNAKSPIPKYEVINFACSSYSTGQELVQYRTEVSRYKPDAVVVLYNRGDSVENVINFKKRPKTEPRPYFYLDSTGKLQQDSSILKDNYYSLIPNPLLDFLRVHSRIYGVISQTHLALMISDPRYRRTFSRLSKILFSLRHQNPASSEPTLYPPQDSLKVTTALLKTLNDEVTANGAHFFLIMFPNIVHDPIYDQQQSELAHFSANQHYSFLDLTNAFSQHSNPLSLFLQFHFSRAGHELVAKQLYTLIDKQLGMPKS